MSNVCEMRAPMGEAAGLRRQPKRGSILAGGMAMGAVLARSGNHVRTAVDAEGVLDALEGQRFDVVLLDLRVPEIDAIATVKLYRYIARGEPQPPIVAVAEPRCAEDVNDCREAGIETCVSPAEAVRAVAELTMRGLVTPPTRESTGVTVSDIATHPRFRAVHRPAAGRSVPAH
jgi:CheY-like chemotaxis protein